MKNKYIYLFLFVIASVIILLVINDFSSSRPGKRSSGPYEFTMDDFKKVDENLIKFRETKQILVNDEPHGIACSDNKIFLLAGNFLQILDFSGKELVKKDFGESPKCIFAGNKKVIIGFLNYFLALDHSGGYLFQSSSENEKSVFTSVSMKKEKIYIADAGMRKVLLYDEQGKKTGEFEGQSGSSLMHGFIVPSPYFDLAVNHENELWVVNPGVHAIQQYRDDGSLVSFWEKPSFEIQGFSGCCNPAHIAIRPDDDFVTSEKGLVRIKIHDKKGELKAVVAAPGQFKDGGKAPDIAVNENGDILALDFDKKMIRIFQIK